MSLTLLPLRPLSLSKPLTSTTSRILTPNVRQRSRHLQNHHRQHQHAHFTSTTPSHSILGLHRNPQTHHPLISHQAVQRKKRAAAHAHALKVAPPPPSARKACPEPLKAVDAAQRKALDPTGARSKLFDPHNTEGAKVGDILLVRTTQGDPFAGVCLDIRRRGVDTAILLRNQLTHVGVEMWFKVYSPAVQGIEIVQRKARRARRARLYFMRLPKHDVGSVDNIVRQYVRQRQALRSGDGVKSRDANSGRRNRVKNRSK